MLVFMIKNQPYRTAVDLRRKPVRRLACHSPILSGVGASGKPGTVHISDLLSDISRRPGVLPDIRSAYLRVDFLCDIHAELAFCLCCRTCKVWQTIFPTHLVVAR